MHYTTLHYTDTVRYDTVHYGKTQGNNKALRCVALRCVALRCVALHCVAMRFDPIWSDQMRFGGMRHQSNRLFFLDYVLSTCVQVGVGITRCIHSHWSNPRHYSLATCLEVNEKVNERICCMFLFMWIMYLLGACLHVLYACERIRGRGWGRENKKGGKRENFKGNIHKVKLWLS